jgi:hypothetical protein
LKCAWGTNTDSTINTTTMPPNVLSQKWWRSPFKPLSKQYWMEFREDETLEMLTTHWILIHTIQ